MANPLPRCSVFLVDLCDSVPLRTGMFISALGMCNKEDGEMTALNSLLKDDVINTCIEGNSNEYMMSSCVLGAHGVLILIYSYWLLKEFKKMMTHLMCSAISCQFRFVLVLPNV